MSLFYTMYSHTQTLNTGAVKYQAQKTHRLKLNLRLQPNWFSRDRERSVDDMWFVIKYVPQIFRMKVLLFVSTRSPLLYFPVSRVLLASSFSIFRSQQWCRPQASSVLPIYSRLCVSLCRRLIASHRSCFARAKLFCPDRVFFLSTKFESKTKTMR